MLDRTVGEKYAESGDLTPTAARKHRHRRGERVMMMCARLAAVSGLCIGLLAAPAAAADRNPPTVAAAQVGGLVTATASADATVANCLLPGQIHKLNGLTMLMPRRAVTLDADACAARGGEPIERTAAAD
jgi:hypothetical protein